MRWRIRTASTLVAVGLLSTACDDKPEVPQAVLDQAKKADEHRGPVVPTTQALLTGTRRRTVLMPFPLTMQVPPGWDRLTDNNAAGIKIPAGMNILQGYTPNGEVQIQLASRSPMKQVELDRIVEAGKREMAQKPQQIVKFELRPLGNLKLLERQSLGTPAPLTVYDSNNLPHTSIESVCNWTLSVLIPTEGRYQVCELNFIGLTKSQYDKDKDFLNAILDTVTDAESGGTTSTAAAPPTSAPASTR